MAQGRNKRQAGSPLVTMKDLGTFTEEVIFPGVERIIDERMERRLEKFKEEVVEDISKRTIKSNDEVITKLDTLIKDNAAHIMSHQRIDDTLHQHDKRIKKLEEVSRAPHASV